MADTHRFQGSTIRPDCCIVLLFPGTDELWDGKMGQSALLQRCGRGVLDPVHKDNKVWTTSNERRWDDDDAHMDGGA